MFIYQCTHKTIRRIAFNGRIWAILLAAMVTVTLVSPGGTPHAALGASFTATTPNDGELSSLPQATQAYGQLPTTFELNQGQTDDRVNFLARSGGYTLFLKDDQAVFALRQAVEAERSSAAENTDPPEYRYEALTMALVGSNPNPAVSGEDLQPGISNYFLGNDPAQWVTDVPHYGQVRYQDVYPGVDLLYYGHQQLLQYDFIAAPGADPGVIRLDFAPVERMELAENGDLLLHLENGTVRQNAPFAYQEIGDQRLEIASRFVLLADAQVGFGVGAYDPSLPLVIDPTLIFSTFVGGSGPDQIMDMTIDSGGSAYAAGYTDSPDFPTTPGAFDTTYNGGINNRFDAFVTKLSPSGDALVYATYVGGRLEGDQANGIAVDAAGNAYIEGGTSSADFPTTSGAFDITLAAHDAFITKLSPGGNSLVYSTFLGGTSGDDAYDVSLDTSGNTYIIGGSWSSNFPTTPGAYSTSSNGSRDIFVTKLNSTGTALVFSTYIGGSGDERGTGGFVDSNGNVYVTAQTASFDYPTLNPLQSTKAGNDDAAITVLSASGAALIYSTYFGGTDYDRGTRIGADDSGKLYVTGVTRSTDLSTTAGAFDTTANGNFDTFILSIDVVGGTLIYSTYLGGGNEESVQGIVVRSDGSVCVVGYTSSTDFPTQNPYQSTNAGARDAFVAILDASGDGLTFSTYLGGSGSDEGWGIAIDNAGFLYVAGFSSSTNFPILNAYQSTNAGNLDGFITKIDLASTILGTVEFATPGGGSVAEDAGTYSADVTLTVTGSGTLSSLFTIDVTFGGAATPGMDYTPAGPTISVTFTNAGGFTAGTYTQTVTLTITDDTEVEGTESVVMTLSNPSDPLVSLGANTVHTVNILDNDVATAGSVEFTNLGGGSIAEDVGTYSTEVALTVTGSGALSSPITVDVTFSGVATPGTDYTPAGPTIPITFTNAGGFPAGSYTQNVTLTITDDTEVEGSESIILSLENPGDSLISLGPITNHTVTITNTDTFPNVPPTPGSDGDGDQPGFGIFDPAISKMGTLESGSLGLPGEQITWHITVTGGGISASDVVVTDIVPVELRIDGVSTTKDTFTVSGQMITFIIGELTSGEVVHLEVLTTVLSSPLGGLITNTATVTGSGVSESATGVINVVTSLPSTGYPPG